MSATRRARRRAHQAAIAVDKRAETTRRRALSGKSVWICVPKTRNIVDPTSEEKDRAVAPVYAKYSFHKFLINNILPDKHFAANWKTIRTAGEIEEVFEDAEEGCWYELHATGHDLAKKVCEEPAAGFVNPHLLIQCLDMFEAIVNAKEAIPVGGRRGRTRAERAAGRPPYEPVAAPLAEAGGAA